MLSPDEVACFEGEMGESEFTPPAEANRNSPIPHALPVQFIPEEETFILKDIICIPEGGNIFS